MPVRKYLTPEEAERVLVRTSDPMDKLLLQVGMMLGCRVSEIITLRIKNIEGQLIEIWDEKKDEPRTCVVDAETASAIEDYLRRHYKAPRGVRKEFRVLFPISYKTANRIVKKAFLRAEIPKAVPARWHTLRHSYIRWVLDRHKDGGIQIAMLQTGDTAETILNLYAVPSVDMRLDVAADLKLILNRG